MRKELSMHKTTPSTYYDCMRMYYLAILKCVYAIKLEAAATMNKITMEWKKKDRVQNDNNRYSCRSSSY